MPVDLDFRLLPDAVRLSPGIELNLGDGDAIASTGENLPLTVPPDYVRVHSHMAVRPDWAWPAAMAAAVALHAAVGFLLVVAWMPPPFSLPPELIDVTVVSETDAAPGQAAGVAAASTDESKLNDAAPQPTATAAPAPAVAETHPQAPPANPLDEETSPLSPVPEATPELPQLAAPNAAPPPPERPAVEDQGANASTTQAPPTSSEPFQPPPSHDATAAPGPPSGEPASPAPTPEALSAPATERHESEEPTVIASARAEPVRADPTSEAPASPGPGPALVAPQLPRPAAKPVAPATRRPHETTNSTPARPPRPVVARPPKPVEKAPVTQNKPAPPAPAEAHGNALARESLFAPARQAADAGAAAGSPGGSQTARASYGAILSAEIARHKVYPDAARAVDATGSVGVVLTVGAAGRIVSHSITRSSGNAAIDHEVDAMMAAVRAPPPPGGVFHTGVTIRFSLR
jgi:protein TonB